MFNHSCVHSSNCIVCEKYSIIVACPCSVLRCGDKLTKVGTKLVGTTISDTTIKSLAKLNPRIIGSVESKMQETMATYSMQKLPNVRLDALLKAQVKYLQLAGAAISKLSQEPEEDGVEGFVGGDAAFQGLCHAESKLRSLLAGSGCSSMPERILPDVAGNLEGRKATAATADELPAIRTENGVVVVGAAEKARAMGMHVGCTAILSHKGEQHEVKFQGVEGDDKAIVLRGDKKVTVPIARLSIPAKDEKEDKKEKPKDVRPKPENWKPVDDEVVSAAVKQAVLAGLFQAHVGTGPDMSSMRKHAGLDEFSLEVDANVGAICLTPLPASLEEVEADSAVDAGPPKRQKRVGKQGKGFPIYVKVSIPGFKNKIYKCKPSNALFFKYLENPSMRCVEVPTLQWKVATTKLEVSCATVAEGPGKKPIAQRKSTKMTLQVSYPILVNVAKLDKWTILTAPAEDPPMEWQ